LQSSAIAEKLANALRYSDEKRYRLFALCVIPNHGHVVARLFPGQSTGDSGTFHWKSFSAKPANRILREARRFLAREYHEHLIRSEEEFERAIR